jgi:hypothetical protein
MGFAQEARKSLLIFFVKDDEPLLVLLDHKSVKSILSFRAGGEVKGLVFQPLHANDVSMPLISGTVCQA